MHRHRKLMTLRVQFYNGLCVCRIWYLHTYYEYVVRNIVLVVHSRRKNQFLLSWLRKEGSMCLESVVVNVYWHLLATWLTQCMTAAAAAGPATVACYLSTHVGNNKKKCVATLAQPCEIVLPSIFRVSALHAGSVLCISSSVKKGTALSMKKGVWPLDWPFWHLWPWQTGRQTDSNGLLSLVYYHQPVTGAFKRRNNNDKLLTPSSKWAYISSSKYVSLLEVDIT